VAHQVVLPINFIQNGEETGKLTKKLMINKILSKSLSRNVSEAWLLVSEKNSDSKFVPFEDIGNYGGKHGFRGGPIVVVSCDGEAPLIHTGEKVAQDHTHENERDIKDQAQKQTKKPQIRRSSKTTARQLSAPELTVRSEIIEPGTDIMHDASARHRSNNRKSRRQSVACDGRDGAELPTSTLLLPSSPLPHVPLPSSKMHPGIALRAGVSSWGNITCL